MPKLRPPPAAAADPHAALTAFIVLLEREQQLLAQPQADALEGIAGEKQALLKQMEIPGRNARAALQDPALHALATHAQHLNAANARMLALHRASCERRLQLLRGGPSANTLYSATGYLGA
jgi:flagellar biosynthesis/type III secretory pathway chaperone